MRAGYVRGVYSSLEIERILYAFADASCGEVVIDVCSHKRRLLERLAGRLTPGDTLTVWTFDCVASEAGGLVQLIAALNGRSVGFESIANDFSVPASSTIPPAMIADAVDRTRAKVSLPERPLIWRPAIALASLNRAGARAFAAASAH